MHCPKGMHGSASPCGFLSSITGPAVRNATAAWQLHSTGSPVGLGSISCSAGRIVTYSDALLQRLSSRKSWSVATARSTLISVHACHDPEASRTGRSALKAIWCHWRCRAVETGAACPDTGAWPHAVCPLLEVHAAHPSNGACCLPFQRNIPDRQAASPSLLHRTHPPDSHHRAEDCPPPPPAGASRTPCKSEAATGR